MESHLDLETLCRQRAHHLAGGRFHNPWGPHDHRRMMREFVRWWFTANPKRREKRESRGPDPVVPTFASLERGEEDYLLWLGHATVYGRLGGVHFITDPIFGGIMGYFARRNSCPTDEEGLPALDLVLISHDHMDHLDLPSLQALERRFTPQIIAGLGLGNWLRKQNFQRVREVDWWERTSVESSSGDGLVVFCFPVQHWSRRNAFDTDRRLWCGFGLRGPRTNLAFVGDSGYFPGFAEIGAKAGPFDVAALPIGAYQPRRLMAPQHMNPAESYQAAVDLGARTLIPTHFGTFGLGDDPLDLAPKELMEAAERYADSADSGQKLPTPAILRPGEPFRFEL